MRSLNKAETMELLEKGALIEVTQWGLNPQPYIRFQERFDAINRRVFYNLRTKGQLEELHIERLTHTYRLTSYGKTVGENKE